MLDLSYDAYVWTRVVHVIAVTAWIGGLIGLSEVFALHAETGDDGLWLSRERALLGRVLIPASGIALATGMVLVLNYGELTEGWLHAKFLAVFLLLVDQIVLTRQISRFASGANIRLPIFFRRLKLFPIALFIGIVALVIVRPF
jgi:protoporphyrinogen IX oxidase